MWVLIVAFGFIVGVTAGWVANDMSLDLSMDDNTLEAVKSVERIAELSYTKSCAETCAYMSYLFNISVNCTGLCIELEEYYD